MDIMRELKVRERKYKKEFHSVLALSVTMSYHIEAAKNTIAALRSYFDSKVPRIIVGGMAFLNCKDSCRETGADFYGLSLEDVVSAIEKGEFS